MDSTINTVLNDITSLEGLEDKLLFSGATKVLANSTGAVTTGTVQVSQEETEVYFQFKSYPSGSSTETIRLQISYEQYDSLMCNMFDSESDASIAFRFTETGGTQVVTCLVSKDSMKFYKPIDMNSQRIHNLDDPVQDQDAATKTYVDTNGAASLAPSVSTLETEVAQLETDMETNTSSIGNLNTTVSDNTSSISANASAISSNTSNISSNTSSIATNTSSLENKEPYLGVPSNNNYVLASNLAGTRFWQAGGEPNPTNYPMSGNVTGTTDENIVSFVDGVSASEISDTVNQIDGDYSFTGLPDTPASYSNTAKQVVVVNTSGDGLTFTDAIQAGLADTYGNTQLTVSSTGIQCKKIMIEQSDGYYSVSVSDNSSSMQFGIVSRQVNGIDSTSFDSRLGRQFTFQMRNASNSGIDAVIISYTSFQVVVEALFKAGITAQSAPATEHYKYIPSSGTYTGQQLFGMAYANDLNNIYSYVQKPISFQIQNSSATSFTNVLQVGYGSVNCYVPLNLTENIDLDNNKITSLLDPVR